MDTEQIKLKKQEVIEKYGDWTAHNIHLKDDLYTYDQARPDFASQLAGNGIHLRCILQAAADIANQPLSSLRVLDLACLEGMYGIEFARHGAEVVGIEGRETNIEKARFAKDAIGLDNITFVQDDVRNLSVDKYGYFDVVLCLGILYHLDAPDVFEFVENMAKVCRRVTIIDTHTGLEANSTQIHNNQEYHGWLYPEHPPEATTEQKLKWLWASLDNEKSFWFTQPSLYKMLSQAGFTSVYSCKNPPVPGRYADRDTLAAVKGENLELLSTPGQHALSGQIWPEGSKAAAHPTQQAYLDHLITENQQPEAPKPVEQTPPTPLSKARRFARRFFDRGSS